MRPTFMGFETARKGIMINQKALDIVSNNIGNIGVTGYTRQRVDQVSMSLSGIGSRYVMKQHTLAGQGAHITGVSQVRDPFLDKRFREEYADVGYYDKTVQILTDVETALDEYDSDGLKSALASFSQAISTLHGEINPTNANIVRTTAKSITQVLKQFDVKLDNIMEQQKYDLEINVDSVNSILERIANLNDSIQKEVYAATGKPNSYFGPNELLDERNVLLDQLAEYGDISFTRLNDGTVTVEMGGHTVVEGSKFETMSYVKNDNNTVTVAWQSNGKDITTTSGSIMASINMINGRGAAATGDENFERGIPYYKDKIDTFAVTFANTFNNTIPEFDENGEIIYQTDPATGDPILDADGNRIPRYKTLFTFDTNARNRGAESISISDEWNNDPKFILTPQNKDGAYDNTYYQVMLDKFKQNLDFGEFTGTMEDYVKFYNTTLGEDKTFNESRLSATSAITENLLDSIGQVSGVSMEEEGVEMVMYTKALNAVSRVMTALDEALDTLINKTGLVGR